MKCDVFFVRRINPIQGSKDWSKGIKTDCMIISDFKERKKKEKKYIDQSGHDANNNSLAKYERKLKMRRSIRFGTVGRWPCDQSFIIKSKMCVDRLCIFKKRTDCYAFG